MENVRPVFVDEDTGFVVLVVSVPADVMPLVADQHLLIQPARKPFREDASGEAGADDEVIETVRCLHAAVVATPRFDISTFST